MTQKEAIYNNAKSREDKVMKIEKEDNSDKGASG